MFARFDENPAMTLRVIKETKRYGRTDARTDGRTDNVKTVYPLQTKFAGGIKRQVLRRVCRIQMAAKHNEESQKILPDFSLTVKAATLICTSGCGSAISSAKEGKSGFFIIW